MMIAVLMAAIGAAIFASVAIKSASLRRETRAALVGFLVASVIPSAVLSVLWPLGGDWSLASIGISLLVTYPFSAAAVLVFGVPAFFLLRPLRPGHWWSVGSVGFLLGLLVDVVLHLPYWDPFSLEMLTTGILGAASALVFWLIWKRSATSKSEPSLSNGGY